MVHSIIVRTVLVHQSQLLFAAEVTKKFSRFLHTVMTFEVMFMKRIKSLKML